MIYFCVHFLDGNFYTPCYYKSTGKTEEGKALGRRREWRLPGKDSLATEDSKIFSKSKDIYH